MLKRNKKRILVSGIVVFALILYFKPFSSTEIIILTHMTETGDNGVVNQICLVKNPPYFSSGLESKIEAFNKSNPVKGKYYLRTFLKEHDQVWFPTMSLQENLDYESRNVTREDLNDIDLLANSQFTLTKKGGFQKETHLWTGDLWYYKY